MRVLIACEYSGVIRDEFTRMGHLAVSCDYDSSDSEGYHYQGNVLDILDPDQWDLLIAHPPCTYLSKAGACRMYPQKGVLDLDRYRKAQESARFFRLLLNSGIKHICIENPTPLKVCGLPEPSQVIQPYQFGDPYSKRTLLWLKNLPPLQYTNVLSNYVPFVPSGTSRKLGGISYGAAPRGNDAKNRSKTFLGIAKAMASQWSDLDQLNEASL